MSRSELPFVNESWEKHKSIFGVCQELRARSPLEEIEEEDAADPEVHTKARLYLAEQERRGNAVCSTR